MTNTRKVLAAAGVSGAAALLGGALAATWYYASRLTQPPAELWPPDPAPDDRVVVVSATPTGVVLEGADAARPGVWGLVWATGYGRLGPPVESDDGLVARPFELLDGEPPADDTPAVLDGYAYPADPAALGLVWEDVTYDTALGPAPAWLFPGARATWVVFVHGRSARRHEAFRMLPTVAALGFPGLVISYRNDPDAPRSPDGRSHLGATEWQDVESAIRYALDHGAEDVILVGFSMGGACVANVARLSELSTADPRPRPGGAGARLGPRDPGGGGRPRPARRGPPLAAPGDDEARQRPDRDRLVHDAARARQLPAPEAAHPR